MGRKDTCVHLFFVERSGQGNVRCQSSLYNDVGILGIKEPMLILPILIKINMLPESLDKILTAIDYLEFDIDILTLDVSIDPLKMDCLIRNTEDSEGQTKVSMTAFGWQDFHIDDESCRSSHIHLEDNHPLLWKFNDTQCELYISGGKPEQIEKVVFDLLQIHYSIFGKFRVFDFQLLNILNSGYGLLKKDSKKLLTEFTTSLEKNGVRATIIGERGASEQSQLLKILFIGHSYIIADKFEFEVADKEPKDI